MSKKKIVDCECGCDLCHDPEVLTYWKNNNNEIVIQGKEEYIESIFSFIQKDMFSQKNKKK